jgi:hypothetical protein
MLMINAPDCVIAEERRVTKRAEHQGKEGSTKTQNKREKRHGRVLVVLVSRQHFLVELAVGVEVGNETITRG